MWRPSTMAAEDRNQITDPDGNEDWLVAAVHRGG